MANSLNFLSPATGAVDPTAAQVAQISTVTVDSTIDGTGTTQVINHNLGLSAADVTAGYPDVELTPTGVLSSEVGTDVILAPDGTRILPENLLHRMQDPTVSDPCAMAWSSSDSESRAEPSAALAMSASAPSSIFTFSFSASVAR